MGALRGNRAVPDEGPLTVASRGADGVLVATAYARKSVEPSEAARILRGLLAYIGPEAAAATVRVRAAHGSDDEEDGGKLVATLSAGADRLRYADLRGERETGIDPTEVARCINAWLVVRSIPERLAVLRASEETESGWWLRVAAGEEAPVSGTIPLPDAPKARSYVASGLAIPYRGTPDFAYEKVSLISDAPLTWLGFDVPAGSEFTLCGVLDELKMGRPPYQVTGVTWRQPLEIGALKLQAYASLERLGGRDVVAGALARKASHGGEPLRAGDQVWVDATGQIVRSKRVER